MSAETDQNARLGALLSRLRRYRVGAVYAPFAARDAVARAFVGAAPGGATLDLLEGLAPGALDTLLSRDVVVRTEAGGRAAPLLINHSEALWSPLSPRKLGDAWRALALSEAPPAPRVLLLHSPFFLDRLDVAFTGSPQPGRLLRW